MSHKKGLMSEQMKNELAKDLGFADKVETGSWASITTGQAGSMVKRAVEMAKKQIVNEEMQIPKPEDKRRESGIGNRALGALEHDPLEIHDRES